LILDEKLEISWKKNFQQIFFCWRFFKLFFLWAVRLLVAKEAKDSINSLIDYDSDKEMNWISLKEIRMALNNLLLSNNHPPSNHYLSKVDKRTAANSIMQVRFSQKGSKSLPKFIFENLKNIRLEDGYLAGSHFWHTQSPH
jgi:hypothetical protein